MTAPTEQAKAAINLFRTVNTKDAAGDHEYRRTMRAPGNVPYIVDNL